MSARRNLGAMRTVLLLLIAGAWGALAGADPIARSAAGVAIAVPADWRAAPLTGAALTLESPHDVKDQAAVRAAGRLALTVTPTEVATAADAAAVLRVDLERVALAFEVLEDAETVIAGRAWRTLRFRFRTGQLGWEQRLLVAVDGGRVAHLSLSTDLDHADDWSAAFAAVVESLRWDPAAPLE
ncbi:MAG TPA: hypothetical protein VEL07_00120 [Planctomycetota bacterium]|nr:hypothetical protein [Planctomycetota bacterium]